MDETEGRICEWCEEAEAKREIRLLGEGAAGDEESLTGIELCDVCYELMRDGDLIENILSKRAPDPEL